MCTHGFRGLPYEALHSKSEVGPYRLTARTAGFQSANRGSIPRRATLVKQIV
ncbi:MAG: hypothetical protein RL536_248 [Candidatus Parcubacteria bacterium]